MKRGLKYANNSYFVDFLKMQYSRIIIDYIIITTDACVYLLIRLFVGVTLDVLKGERHTCMCGVQIIMLRHCFF